ncbi:MAG: transposase [Nitrosomonadales bacterium]|nr:transposase [Nitrosomonadales bacterium]
MTEYRRAHVPGASERRMGEAKRNPSFDAGGNNCWVLLRATQPTKASLPFAVVAWVLLPEHLHCIWRLPDGGADFSKRCALNLASEVECE